MAAQPEAYLNHCAENAGDNERLARPWKFGGRCNKNRIDARCAISWMVWLSFRTGARARKAFRRRCAGRAVLMTTRSVDKKYGNGPDQSRVCWARSRDGARFCPAPASTRNERAVSGLMEFRPRACTGRAVARGANAATPPKKPTPHKPRIGWYFRPSLRGLLLRVPRL